MKRRWGYVLFFIFILFTIIGLKFGEFASVLEKSITVCLTCIGIG
jgi:predicted Na+-dependent transporter